MRSFRALMALTVMSKYLGWLAGAFAFLAPDAALVVFFLGAAFFSALAGVAGAGATAVSLIVVDS